MALKTTRLFRNSARKLVLGASLLLSAFTASPALAITHHYHRHSTHLIGATHELSYRHTAYHHRLGHHYEPRATIAAYYDDGAGYHMATPYRHHYRHTRYAHYRHSYLQCVPYAREISHIDLSGDAFLWWAEASGRYARGNVPAEGAVLNFRAIGRMPLGHVAVVTAVEDSRTILITQANWVPGSITNDVTVEDVSPNNDWTQVQVELGDSSKWGASYPTYGFIYNKPDAGTVIAAAGQGNEVAEAPAATQVSDDAPDRDLQ
jgi:surface antigen